MRAVNEATEAVIQSGDTVIEENVWDAAEAALDGRPKAISGRHNQREGGRAVQGEERMEGAVT